jgi:hypothetical protein
VKKCVAKVSKRLTRLLNDVQYSSVSAGTQTIRPLQFGKGT